MSALSNSTSIAAYIACEASNAEPQRALAMLKVLVERLARKGLTLEGVIEDALNPHRRFDQMPRQKLSGKNRRLWTVYMLSRRDELPAKDVQHLKVTYQQKTYLRKDQMRWIHDILFRMEPAACGTWGAPE
jgi:hypothetical protein